MTQIVHQTPSEDFNIRFLDTVDPLAVQSTLTGLGYRVELTRSPSSPPLSVRERQILKGVAEGYPDKFIAADLGIRPRTVRYHLQRIMEKLGAQNRTSAVVKALTYLLKTG